MTETACDSNMGPLTPGAAELSIVGSQALKKTSSIMVWWCVVCSETAAHAMAPPANIACDSTMAPLALAASSTQYKGHML